MQPLKRDPYPLLIASAFLAAGTLVIAHHELWRDEVQSWLLARDSSSAWDLLSRQKYEGHPALWQLLLFPLTRVCNTPLAMQGLHLLIATTTVYLFVGFSPFSLLQRVLFSFGYFPFYEYSVISRSYGLSLLLLTVFCCLYPRRERHFLLIALTLALLCHVHALGLIMAFVVFGALCFERFIVQPGCASKRSPARSFYAGTALFLVGAVTAAIQIRPPEDSGIAMGWQLAANYDALRETAQALVGAYLPVPRLGLHYWNYPVFVESRLFPLNLICYLAVPGYLLFALLSLRRSAMAALVFSVGTFALLAFFYTKYSGYARHHGFLFVCLVVSVWMYRSDEPIRSGTTADPRHLRWQKAFAASLTLLLGVHVIAAALASTLEYRYPFSAAAKVAEYLHRNGHDESLLVAREDYAALAILGFSAQKQMYYPQARRWGSYIIWNKARLRAATDEEMIQEARALPRRAGQHLLLVLNRSLHGRIVEKYGLSELGFFSESVVPDENFHLYECEPTGRP